MGIIGAILDTVSGKVIAILVALLLAAAIGLHFEHAWRLQAEAQRDGALKGNEIWKERALGSEEREKILAEAEGRRQKINVLRQKSDVAGLSDYLNNPAGVRGGVPADSKGGPVPVPRYTDPASPGTAYHPAKR
jgi:hypothetical protein